MVIAHAWRCDPSTITNVESADDDLLEGLAAFPVAAFPAAMRDAGACARLVACISARVAPPLSAAEVWETAILLNRSRAEPLYDTLVWLANIAARTGASANSSA